MSSRDPRVTLMQMIAGKAISQSLRVVADLEIPDLLAESPMTAEKIAATVGVDAQALFRVLRALSTVGVFERAEDDTFSNSELSTLLMKEHGSMRAMLRWVIADAGWMAWRHLDYAVQTGKPAFDHAFNQTPFEYMRDNVDTADRFQAAMTSYSDMTSALVVATYSLESASTVVDVGGGRGGMLQSLIRRYPHVRGVLFELPDVVDKFDESNSPALTENRITIHRGDFFVDPIPTGGDVYFLKHILHSWDDSDSIKILSACQRALGPDAKLVVIDRVLSEEPNGFLAEFADLEMLVLTPGGKERTQVEFESLFSAAGLRLTRVIDAGARGSMLEAVVA